MPDWKVGEFEGKFKDEFVQNNNREQDDEVGLLNISNKKLKHGVGVASENNKGGVMSGANNSDPQKCNSERIHSTNVIGPQGINSADDRAGDCKAESSAFPLSTEDTISGTRYQTENWNSCQFALTNGSAVLNNHSVPQSDISYGDNDLFIDWPSIVNFEDVDTLFRCDSTYGEQQLENTDELSWIPSSDAIYSSDVALQAGFDSSYSDYGILDDLSAFHCEQDKSLPTADPSAVVCDEQFNGNYPFNEQNNINVYGGQAYQEDAMDLLSAGQICNGDRNIDMIEERHSSENSMQQLEDRKFSVASGSQLSSSQKLLKHMQHSDSTSASNITSESYPARNYQFSPSEASFAQRNLNVQKKVANLQPGQSINDTEHPGHQILAKRASFACENYDVKKKGLGKRNMGDRQVPLGTSMVVDGSFLSSVSSDNSVEENSFRQLQDAVGQLDVKTKLCIRDGLYRLARSAQNRPVFSNATDSHGDSQDTKDTQNAEALGKFVDCRRIETQTNPIDRSIALLLFHQPSDQVAGDVEDPCH
ncbi:protein LNK1 isoform X2 [Brachypodium distachyon]|uniref:Protein LNK1 n=1 Tax=Brachypodium distachyon TaxID=15368 RepID=I1H4X7_BRADI|nr:protein LNK1 isoform X2 [Brachypodium distachyon]KQK21456.1 hypothetical protein BRADI_1g60846v3 [Brachypodium distachyon]PNT77304.1 hypothetical protein BRADI_1g60846v3 [Brachypodium distachyon]|eukprot:XP_010228550.1 protein LNK1 isoform X2 [Brachypodium distachyon]